MEERRAHAAAPKCPADRSLLPRPAGAAADREGLFDRPDDGGPDAELRDRRLWPGALRCLLDPETGDRGLVGGEGLELQPCGGADRGAGHAQAEGRAAARDAEDDLGGPRETGGFLHRPIDPSLQGTDRPSGGAVGTGHRPACHAAAGGAAVGLRRGEPGGAGARPFAGPAFDRGDPGSHPVDAAGRPSGRGRTPALGPGLRHRARVEGGTRGDRRNEDGNRRRQRARPRGGRGGASRWRRPHRGTGGGGPHGAARLRPHRRGAGPGRDRQDDHAAPGPGTCRGQASDWARALGRGGAGAGARIRHPCPDPAMVPDALPRGRAGTAPRSTTSGNCSAIRCWCSTRRRWSRPTRCAR